jgi:hypothetical protein
VPVGFMRDGGMPTTEGNQSEIDIEDAGVIASTTNKPVRRPWIVTQMPSGRLVPVRGLNVPNPYWKTEFDTREAALAQITRHERWRSNVETVMWAAIGTAATMAIGVIATNL